MEDKAVYIEKPITSVDSEGNIKEGVEVQEVANVNMDMEMNINEIFLSVQGEGSFMGFPAIFIRTNECNLKCPWCDSKETWSTNNENAMKTSDILAKCKELAGDEKPIVVITGGEPLIYLDAVKNLVLGLHLERFEVHIETNGTIDYTMDADDYVEYYPDWIVASPKPPAYKLEITNPSEIKLVVDDNLKNDIVEGFEAHHIWLQPESCKKDSVKKARQIMKDLPNNALRMGIQAHKYWEVN